mmetsp:Transcript_160/g.254  ORF Transcript_160/g.254 Transcript_160/m.254 type:complete len:263 (+) Transcript_160:86-874(+)
MMFIRTIIPLIAFILLSTKANADDSLNLRGVSEDEYSMEGRRQLNIWMDLLTALGHVCRCDGHNGPLSCHVPKQQDCENHCPNENSSGRFCSACRQCSSNGSSSSSSGTNPDEAAVTDSFTPATGDGYWNPDADEKSTHSSAADGAYTYSGSGEEEAGNGSQAYSGASSVALWGYIAGAAAITAFIIAAVMRKRNHKEDEHNLDGAVAKRMTLLEDDDASVSTTTSKGTEPPTFIDMEPDAVQIGISGATEPSASPSNYSSF